VQFETPVESIVEKPGLVPKNPSLKNANILSEGHQKYIS
jgi:hypothetical protein